MEKHAEKPTKHILGFLLSLVLTFLALWFAFSSHLSKTVILTSIIVLAILQALLQLLMFMHMTESKDGKWQTTNIIYAFFIAICVVAGSIWVMSFSGM